MSLHRVVLSVVAVLSLAFLIACGSSSSTTPPPSGAFSNANLSGTYVFNIVGSDDSVGDFQAITGTFTANGSGGIGSSGAVDFADVTGDSPDTTISGGSYSVGKDGRGQAILTTTNPIGIASNLTVDFVLSSSSGASSGLITQFDGNGTGSGTLALQTSASAPSGNYVVALSGVFGSGQAPLAIAGAITVTSGAITGSVDYNDAGDSNICAITSGSITAGNPGTASVTTGSPCNSTLTFDVYPISTTDQKLITIPTNNDEYPILSGDLFSQTSSTFPSGQLVFTMAGIDNTTSPALPTVMGGLVTSSGATSGGAAGTLSAGEEDYNDEYVSNVTSSSSPAVSFTGTITNFPASSSRYVLTLNTFVNVGGGPNTWGFAAYPTDNNGIVLIEEDSSGGAIAGTAYVQSSTALSSGTGYGMNLTGINDEGGSGFFEEDDNAEFVTTSTGFSGAIDMNDQIGLTPGSEGDFTGNYGGIDATATGRGLITSTTPDSNNPNIDAVYYTVSPSQTVMVEVDSIQTGIGTLITQSGSSSSSLAQSFAQQHMAVVRAAAKAMKAKKAKEDK